MMLINNNKWKSLIEQFGPLIGIFCVVVCASAFFLFLNSIDPSVPKNNLRDLKSLMEKSDSTDAPRYFNGLTKLWYGVALTMDFNSAGLKADLKSEMLGDGMFILTLEGNIGSETLIAQNGKFVPLEGGTESTDLGVVGRDKAIWNMSALVWACGDKIKNVRKIAVHLVETAGLDAVRYEAELLPNADFFRVWSNYTNPELRSLVVKNMVTIADTASGHSMVYKRKY